MFTGDEYILEAKGGGTELSYDIQLEQTVTAPVAKGQKLGTMNVCRGGQLLARVEIAATEDVGRLSLFSIYGRLFGALIGRKVA